MSPDGPAPRRAAVLGSPIGHSLSPVLHRAAYADLGLDWRRGEAYFAQQFFGQTRFE